MARSVVYFVFTIIVLGIVESNHVNEGIIDLQDIPKRCIENSVTPVSCKDVVTSDSLIPHPDDCQLFYYCVSPDHAPICRQCPANLHFNPDKHVCDQPENARCQTN